MKNTNGWIKWWRQAEKNDVLEDDKFDRTHAFMYMVMMANTKQAKTRYGETIKRGQFKTSIRKLSQAFGWGHTKTECYLNDLENKGMIRTKRTPNGTLVTIVKYGKFQDVRDTKKDTDRHTDRNTDRNADRPLYKKIGENKKEAPNSASCDTESVPKEEWLPPVEEW